MDLDVRIDPSAIPTTEPSPAPTEAYTEYITDDRAVYDGDISDTILKRLSAYYNEYSQFGDEYVILRESQYVYVLAFGSESSHRFSGTIVRYTTSSYTADSTVSITTGTYTADMTGDTGYIYSSLPAYIPSIYIDSVSRASANIQSISGIVLCISALVALCLTIFRKVGRRR